MTVSCSIVINNYNYARFLGQAIDSALGQTYQPSEVIVVDDGSTDDSRSVIERYGDAITSIFKSNGGQGSALNAGFEASSGEVVIFLDADDTLEPDVAARTVALLLNNPSVGKVMFPLTVVDGDGVPTGVQHPDDPRSLPTGNLRREVLAFPFDLAWTSMSANGFRRTVLEKILPLPDDSSRFGADWFVVHTAALFGDVAALERAGGAYRIHGANQYSTDPTRLDVHHIRKTIVRCTPAEEFIWCVAQRHNVPGLPRSVESMRSVTSLAHRLISLRLEPAQHPIVEDTRWNLMRRGIRAGSRRWDVPIRTRAAFVVWFFLMGVAPRPAAELLARAFVNPASLPGVSRLRSRR